MGEKYFERNSMTFVPLFYFRQLFYLLLWQNLSETIFFFLWTDLYNGKTKRFFKGCFFTRQNFCHRHRRKKIYFFKKDAPLLSFHEVCEKKFALIFVPQLLITFPRKKKTWIILRQKYETGDFAPKISIRSRRIIFLQIDVHVTSKLRTFLWCFSFFSKLLVDTMQIDMNDPSDF